MDSCTSRVALIVCGCFKTIIIIPYLKTALLTWYLVTLVPTLSATSSSNPIMSNHRHDHHSSFFAPLSSSSNNPTHHYVGQSSQSDQPYFSERMQNLTVPVGREATFTCLIHNLKNHQVAWFHKDRHTLLALQDKVITRNSRIRVSSQASKSFSLHINDVQESDGGYYSCQVNSSPMKSQSGHLEVVVPPRFVEHLTSTDMDSQEDSSVSLRCVANGFPMPEIKWRREDGRAINIQSPDGSRATMVPGEYLNITKLQRLDSGAYICIAANGVPPASSKRIFLGVTFSPMIWTPKQTVGAAIGHNIVLECILESYPRSITHWSRLNGPSIIESSTKYESVVTETGSSVYKSEMMLKINNVSPSDFGSYVCSAKNLLGETTGRIKVYEIPKSSLPTSSVTTSKGGNSEERRKDGKVIGSKIEATSSSEGSDKRRKGMTVGKKTKNPSDLHSKHKTLERNHDREEGDDSEEEDDDDDEEETLRSSLRSRTRGLSTPSSASSSSFSSSSSYISSFFSILFCLLHQGHSFSTMATKIIVPTSSPLSSFLIAYFLSFLNSFPLFLHF